MWYPGQEGGAATADLLLGRTNPSGKLPVTFPRHEGDGPTSTPLRYPGVDGRQEYSEGVLVGYRWYDAKGIAPLFPFGHGLSYTTFAYSELTVRPRGDGFDVGFRVRNIGAVACAEAAQVYVGAPEQPPVRWPRSSSSRFSASIWCRGGRARDATCRAARSGVLVRGDEGLGRRTGRASGLRWLVVARHPPSRATRSAQRLNAISQQRAPLRSLAGDDPVGRDGPGVSFDRGSVILIPCTALGGKLGIWL